ncbi:DMT family transporter [Phytomonospora endophytica]|uniref:Drug/metabolite transporter (DMT)-like permease n=1 Tax=Phytomonospora endophytica TaxID=714109 RepID=A0A841FQG3_9ACTN|nr:DMT family transporter [Phytomonospora endophytica]MBB6034799.1 drug/metabolite transporter (DMT)-like permease [Phytomonospora endophytica]GIG68998.1 hypothetical protein Pen01_52930 [Phytomonospora endophytica]
MSPLAIGLVVCAAIAHASWNLYAKRASTGGPVFVWLACAASTVLYFPVVAGVALAVKPDWSLKLLLGVGVSGLLHLSYILFLQRGYAKGDLSVVYPLARGTGPLLSVIVAVVFLQERPSVIALLGTGVVVCGILVIGLGSAGGERMTAMTGVLYGVGSGVMIAAYTVWDSYAVSQLAIIPLIMQWGTGLTRTLALAPYALPRINEIRKVWREHRKPVFVVGILEPLAYLLVLFAFKYAPVTVVAPSRELSIVVGALFGWLLLGESQAVRRIAGALIVLGGIVALAAT